MIQKVRSGLVQPENITGNLIAVGAVTSNTIANGSVTNADLSEPNAFEDYFLLGLR
jgi:hypothetical protein